MWRIRRSLIDQYRKAVAADERSLGKEFIKENTSHFWAMHETRPYMRALKGLAAKPNQGVQLRQIDAGRHGEPNRLTQPSTPFFPLKYPVLLDKMSR